MLRLSLQESQMEITLLHCHIHASVLFHSCAPNFILPALSAFDTTITPCLTLLVALLWTELSLKPPFKFLRDQPLNFMSCSSFQLLYLSSFLDIPLPFLLPFSSCIATSLGPKFPHNIRNINSPYICNVFSSYPHIVRTSATVV